MLPATGKMRLCLEKLGRLLLELSIELAEDFSKFPPLFAAEKLRTSSTTSTQPDMAAYMAELESISTPMRHISASLDSNAVALINARATHTAVDIVSLMASTYLFALCQALDHRVIDQICLEDMVTHHSAPDALAYLGNASKSMYKSVKEDLGIEMLKGDLTDEEVSGRQIGKIYHALRDEQLLGPMTDCLKEAVEQIKKQKTGLSKL